MQWRDFSSLIMTGSAGSDDFSYLHARRALAHINAHVGTCPYMHVTRICTCMRAACEQLHACVCASEHARGAHARALTCVRAYVYACGVRVGPYTSVCSSVFRACGGTLALARLAYVHIAHARLLYL